MALTENKLHIQSVTLSDEVAKKRKVQKTILERKGPPTFTCAVEMISKTECRVHRKLDATVDNILTGTYDVQITRFSYFSIPTTAVLEFLCFHISCLYILLFVLGSLGTWLRLLICINFKFLLIELVFCICHLHNLLFLCMPLVFDHIVALFS